MAAMFAAGWIAGCAQPWTPVGSDRDANGCRPSAGYAWCTQLQSCQRPWELAREQNFVNTAAAFDAYCKNPVKSTGKPPG
ncbi:MAG: hypothetical protein EBS16_08840 [Betaproteobacteria bacterium]|nr:hypothetical protein [Betaproteobacteria bacterium]